MKRIPQNPGAWPRFMRSVTAAAYVDEVSVDSFLRKVGSLYPEPAFGKGRGAKWDKNEIDAVRPKAGQLHDLLDAANVL